MVNCVGSKDNYSTGYSAIHKWVARYKKRTLCCDHCRRKFRRPEFANISGEYKRNLSDWLELCMSCHAKFDGKGEAGRRNIRRWHEKKKTLTHCGKGHKFTPENTKVLATGARLCRECDRARKRRWREKQKGA